MTSKAEFRKRLLRRVAKRFGRKHRQENPLKGYNDKKHKDVSKPLPNWMSADWLWDHYDYNPKTGHLIWLYDEDKPKQWNTRYAGQIAGKYSKGYIYTSIYGRNYAVHRLAYYMMTKEQPPEVDHINLKRDDNRFVNLRAADENKNQHNRRANKNNKSTGVKGVSKNWNRYRAQIKVNGKHIHLGVFDTVEEAAEAYAKASKKYHKDYGRTK